MSRLEVTIHHPDVRGRGEAFFPGTDRRIVVPGAWPGERVEIQIVRRGRPDRPAIARLLRVLEPHPARRDPPCPRHADHPDGQCTGCPLMSLRDAGQRELRRLIAHEHGGLHVDAIEHGSPRGYRWSAKRVVGGRPGSLVFGSYVAGTHRVADMSGCRVDHPRIVAAVDEVRVAANELGIEPFDRQTGGGDLRYLWLKTDGERVLLTLITASAESRAVDELPSKLALPSGIAWSIQTDDGNAVRGGVSTVLRGDETLQLRIADQQVDVGPLGFLQPNPDVAGRAYRALVDGPGPAPCEGELAFDLYAGAGVTTRLLRARFERVLACERYPESAAVLGIEALDAADFLQARRAAGDRPALVIANPPRAGMGAEVCEHLGALGPQRVHIMSCSAVTLAADLEHLQAAGYRIEGLRAFDTLPQTTHLELVAWLSREGSGGGGSHGADAT